MAGLNFGGFVKPQQTAVRASDVPKFGDLSMQEKLLMLGAALQGDTASAMQVPLLAAARRRQADEQAWRGEVAQAMQGVPMLRERALPNAEGEDISAAFSPKMEATRGRPATLRDLVPMLSKGAASGYDIKPWVDLADKTGPDIAYERGFRYDKRDPSSAPAFAMDLDKGQVPVFDADGRPIGVMNAKGYVQSAAELEAAKTEASERAKAGYAIERLPQADGSEVPMTRRQAAEMLSGGGMAEVPVVGGGSAGGAGAFRTQTQRERLGIESEAKERDAYATDAAKAQAERDFMRPKAQAALDAMTAKDKIVSDAVDRALMNADGWTSGAGSILTAIPGTPARDLRSDLETIKANLGFDELQTMRDNSPTGGALGQVAVQELEALRSTLASLDQTQSPQALRAALLRIKEIRKGAAERRLNAFTSTYETRRGGPDRKATTKGSLSDIPLEERLAEARRRGLIE